MRVLHVLEAIEAGVARHVADVVRHVEAEHEVLVPPERVGGYTDRASLEAMEASGARVHLTPMRRSIVDASNAAAVLAARRVIRGRGPDVVHGHASIGGAVARIAAVGTPAARVYTPHALLPGRATAFAERLLGRLTDAVVAVSETEARQVAWLRIVPRERVEVIPNGIELAPPDPPEVGLRALLGVGEEVPLIGSVGRLTPQKAPEVFVRACARIAERSADARFVLIGDGPLRGAVAEEARASGLGGRFTHLPGMQSAARVIGDFDVFALPSRYEAGPYAPLEAMRAGVPVVLSDVVGNRDTVLDGDSGLLVPPDDPDALAAAVEAILGDASLGERLASGGRERLASRFDVRRMASRLSELYRSLAGAHGVARRR